MAKQSIVASGSHMPIDMYLKKMEQTCIYEDPDQMDNYYRSNLKNMRPDKPFFESDAPRRDNYSRDRLNLRHGGSRVNTDPYLPEGTFLDFDFLIKDPRGIALEPDMRKHRKQQEARGKFVKFYNDEDNSVPSSGRAPARVISDRVKGFYPTKNRLMIFEESKDGRHNGGTASSKLTSTGICLQQADQEKPEIMDAMCYNYSTILQDYTNNTHIGWNSTTDHTFKIAKYGPVRINAPINEQNWSKNRNNAKLDHDILLSWQDQNVPMALTIKMIDMMRKKNTDIESGKTVYLHTSKDAQMSRKKKLSAKDLNILNKESQNTHSASMHSLIKSEYTNIQSQKPKLDTKKREKTIIDPVVITFMASINRKMGPREIKDLRDDVKQSCEFNKMLFEQNNNKANRTEADNNMMWESHINHYIKKSEVVANYSNVVRKTLTPQNGATFEQHKMFEKINGQRRGQLINTQYKNDVVKFDNEYGLEADGVKMIGNLGSKYMRRFMNESGRDLNGLNDVSAKNKY